MMKLISLFLFLFPNLLMARQSGIVDENENLHQWKKSEIIAPTETKRARTAVLIIAPPTMGDCFVEQRWKIGKKAWEQYMNSHPDVDCYFIQSTHPRTSRASNDQVWLEGNTIYIGDSWYERYGNDRLLHKSVAAIEWLLPNYTHFIRTNLNIFLNLNSVDDYMRTHHRSFYTTPLWQSAWYTIGYAIFFSADVAAHIVSEYHRLENEELISPNHADDGALTALATGLWPYDKHHPFRCCPTLRKGIRQLMCHSSLETTRLSNYGALLIPPITLETAINYCKMAPDTMMLYRTNGGLNLKEIAQFYEHLLQKHYPQLKCESLVEYMDSLPPYNH